MISECEEVARRPMHLGVVVARLGSQRLPGKNVLLFDGLPLFVWAARALIESEMFRTVVVSTDDERVVGLSEQYGIPALLRSAEAAEYSANVVDVCLDVLGVDSLGVNEHFACVYGTAFKLSSRTVRAACLKFQSMGAPSLMGVSRPAFNPFQVLSVTPEGRATPVFPAFVASPPSGGGELRVSNGTIYIADSDALRTHRSFYMPGLVTIDIPDHEVSDINTPEDALRLGISTGLSGEES